MICPLIRLYSQKEVLVMRRAIPVITLTLLIAMAISPVVSAAPEWTILGYHVVQPGETVYCIARAYGVAPGAIASQNSIVNPNLLYPGTTLAIPDVYATLPSGPCCTPQFGEAPTCTCSSEYTIVSGDTLTRISINFGVSMWRIAECNHIINLNYIRADDTLCIPAP